VSPADRASAELPRRYGKYELLERIGEGGMAEAYRARLPGAAGFEKILVIKRILPHLAKNERFLQMFVNEAKLAARIQHQNVVQVFELGETELGELFMAMEYVQGHDLRAILEMAAERVLRIPVWFSLHAMMQALTGLAHAHELVDEEGRPLGVVHRDVTPSNVFVSYLGEVKLADFGVAKAINQLHAPGPSDTLGGQLKGKTSYMPPEQIQGIPLDPRADVFSAAVVLWELLTQRRLFGGRGDFEIMLAICEEPRPLPSRFNPSVPPELDAIVLRALEPDREHRFPTARAFHAALLEVMSWLRPRLLPSDIQHVVEVLAGRRPSDPVLGADVGVGEEPIPLTVRRRSSAPPSPEGATDAVPRLRRSSAPPLSAWSAPTKTQPARELGGSGGGGMNPPAGAIAPLYAPAKARATPPPAPRDQEEEDGWSDTSADPWGSEGRTVQEAWVADAKIAAANPADADLSLERATTVPPPGWDDPPREPEDPRDLDNPVDAALRAREVSARAGSGSGAAARAPIDRMASEGWSVDASEAPVPWPGMGQRPLSPGRPTELAGPPQPRRAPEVWESGAAPAVLDPSAGWPAPGPLPRSPSSADRFGAPSPASRPAIPAATTGSGELPRWAPETAPSQPGSAPYFGPHPFFARTADGTARGPLDYSVLVSLCEARSPPVIEVSPDGDHWYDLSRFAFLAGLDAFLPERSPLKNVTTMGVLEETSLVHVFAKLGANQATGRLMVMTGSNLSVRRELVLTRGALAYVFADRSDLHLPTIALRREMVTRDRLDAAVHYSLLEQVPFDEGLRKAIGSRSTRYRGLLFRERLAEMFRWRQGKFAFDASLVEPPPFGTIAPSVLQPLFDMVTRCYDIQELHAKLAPFMGAKLAPTTGFEWVLRDLDLGRALEGVAHRLREGKSIGQLVRRAPDQELPFLAIGYILLESGALVRA